MNDTLIKISVFNKLPPGSRIVGVETVDGIDCLRIRFPHRTGERLALFNANTGDYISELVPDDKDEIFRKQARRALELLGTARLEQLAATHAEGFRLGRPLTVPELGIVAAEARAELTRRSSNPA